MQSIDDVAAGDHAQEGRVTADRDGLLRSFAENGYLAFENVVPKDKLSALADGILAAYERSKQSGGMFSAGGTITGHLNCLPGLEGRFVYDALARSGIVDLVTGLTARPLQVTVAGCNVNLPKSLVQHYHIDGSFDDEFVIVNTAAVDTDIENGAIEIIPGSHRRPYEYWRFALERPYRFSKRVRMKQGDVLVRTSRLWHRGMPNRTRVARPMVAMTFNPGVPPVDPFQVNGGHIQFYQNWYRTDWRGQLRERTYAALPITYSAYRFVSSLFGTLRNHAK
jgi:hypothetical protein